MDRNDILTCKRCDTGACVETAETPDHVYIRNSTEPDGPFLRFTREEWAAFVQGLVTETR